MQQQTLNTAVVVPNWNGLADLPECLNSLLAQSYKHRLIVVENGSVDGSLEFLQKKYPQAELVINQTNLGFAGGVNSGIRKAMELGCKYVALFNNDAIADKNWLKHLVTELEAHPKAGIATCKLMSADKKHLDSTGDIYTVWGVPFPRGRGEPVSDKYDKQTAVFAASGGASLYRVAMLEQIGLFDEDFFAYYEDVDLSFRAQLASWKVRYVPKSIAYHQISATSGKIKGFGTYQFMKNTPLLLIKNVPQRYLRRVGWRFMLSRVLFMGRAFTRGQGWVALKGDWHATKLLRKKRAERKQIMATQTVTDEYIWGIMAHDLPPNAYALRRLRAICWRVRRR